MNKQSYIYIIGNERPTVYIGVTSNLIKRVYAHKNKLVDGFSKKYNLTKLLYYEVFEDIYHAIEREKQLKMWRRRWKLDLIREKNPEFKDLYKDIL